MTPVAELDRLLAAAEGSVAPSVSAVVWQDGRVVYARRPGRVYDLASLTKVLCTTELALRVVAADRLALDAGDPRLPSGVTLRHLLQHASGWPPWRPFYELVPPGPDRREAIVRAVFATPVERPPGAGHAYSDLGFIALAALLEDALGARVDRLWRGPLRWGDARSQTTGEGRGGAVNDLNARAMGGVAGHAGLYGSAAEVARVASRWLDGTLPEPWVRRFFTERGPGSHALGWDTPSPGGASSAGDSAPADAVGHLGFTGTSVWLSPSRRRIAVLLTNRVANGADLAGIRALRRAFHGAAWG